MFYQEYPTLTKARQIEYKLKQLKSKQIIERIISDQEIRIG
jgi:predicted GIY-YIG superfamily endonuclease